MFNYLLYFIFFFNIIYFLFYIELLSDFYSLRGNLNKENIREINYKIIKFVDLENFRA